MERVFGGTDKIILDAPSGPGSGGVVPYLPLPELRARTTTPSTPIRPRRREATDETRIWGGVVAVIIVVRLIVARRSLFTVQQTQQALVVRLGDPIRTVTQPGLHTKMPFIDNVIYVDNRILDLENAAQEVICIRSEAARGRCIRPLSHLSIRCCSISR